MEQPHTEGLSNWLREKCEKQGLSLRQAAAKAGLSHTTIAVVINGGNASPTTVRKLAQGFGGNGERRLVIEDRLLVLAGYRTQRTKEELSEPLARLLDKLGQFSEPQLKVMTRFADFLAETEEK
ncbi:hypothetical protein ES703_104301 [subsurface metagenome]